MFPTIVILSILTVVFIVSLFGWLLGITNLSPKWKFVNLMVEVLISALSDLIIDLLIRCVKRHKSSLLSQAKNAGKPAFEKDRGISYPRRCGTAAEKYMGKAKPKNKNLTLSCAVRTIEMRNVFLKSHLNQISQNLYSKRKGMVVKLFKIFIGIVVEKIIAAGLSVTCGFIQ